MPKKQKQPSKGGPGYFSIGILGPGGEKDEGGRVGGLDEPEGEGRERGVVHSRRSAAANSTIYGKQ